MNMRPFLLTATLACAAFSGLAQATGISATSDALPYQYGMPLHVAKVLTLTEAPTLKCKIITADMKYIDSTGKPAQISYRKLSDACSQQN
ncbi:DUF2790 domain-containing protein [Pseudomonas sp. HN2]|jgi:hypothetical protein|uniref:DUF2790 domain-containing protein n=1 Tax=Pseudomonas TaxID=286 RepID=UPI00080E8A2B|nr:MULTISPECIES: DUF2790 domain-containing protein [Pseudomonas]UEB93600.1 DUF2790 domain-containing protein [Pseudomonas sp. HN2]UST67027.1 DUF2790 domain-containing protein [Pseudomonas moraviensis]